MSVIVDNIDFDLLRQQILTLARLVENGQKITSPTDKEHLDGILNLLEMIQDQGPMNENEEN